MAKLLDNFLMEEVELGLAIGTIAEEADTYTLPITTTHGEGIASR